ncbi:hypothetical protein AMTR_s00200p00028910 [Amborella trichopoda]|uniref:Aminotransferase-like plant mobile domain-containing protein n=1 Tax=Amborella trichopoda TaxID=13333 RepID=W1NS20_AMBTC|nr:hypothetical protein AMTR_s00200p00028910 [Amborella trichopoda]
MMLTLYDTWKIHWLNVIGNPVLTRDCWPYNTYINKWLGDCQEESKLYTLKYKWLKERVMEQPEDATHVVTMQHMRAYLLYIVGHTIFSNVKGNEVPMRYATLLEDLECTGSYALGAVALTYTCLGRFKSL